MSKMTKQQAIHAAIVIDQTYLMRWAQAHTTKRSEAGTGVAHLRWMVEEISKGEMSEDQTMRWLGYIQGALVCCYACDLDDMEAINKAQSARAQHGPIADFNTE